MPAAKAIEPGQMLMVMGTSTCHVMNSDQLGEVPGMCGVVHDGIVPGLYGYEAGQSGVGDIFAWHAEHGVPPAYHDAAREQGVSLHEHLTELASAQRIGQHGLVALDWHSGNRSVLVDHELSGVIVGLTLATRPEEVYRALLESTAFGTRTIVEAFEAAGRRGAGAHDRRRPAAQPVPDADVRRRDAPRAEPARVRAGPRARRGHARRGGRRVLPRHRRGVGRDGPPAPRRLHARRGRPRPPTTRCTRSTRRCTTTSAAATNEVMHRLRRIRRESR